MTDTARASISGLLDQFEAIGGPEQFGPEGVAILIAVWRKSRKLGWKPTFQMTNTELMVQTGIATRKTLNTYRGRLVEANLIGYEPPPNGSSRGTYHIHLNLLNAEPAPEPVTSRNSFEDIKSKPDPQPVTSSYSFPQPAPEPVTSGNSFGNTVLKDTITTLTPITKDSVEYSEQLMELITAYCALHKKFDIHLKAVEREAMAEMVAGGMPNPFTIRTMEILYTQKQQRQGEQFQPPTSFLYYVPGIKEAWQNVQETVRPTEEASAMPASSVPAAPRQTKQQLELQQLEKMLKEEQERGQSGSYSAATHH